jgi:hypothetical protein
MEGEEVGNVYIDTRSGLSITFSVDIEDGKKYVLIHVYNEEMFAEVKVESENGEIEPETISSNLEEIAEIF